MSYKTCRVKNIDTSTDTYVGKELIADEIYQIPDIERINWANNDNVLSAITDDKLQIGDGENWFTSYNEQVNWLKDY